jgi:hypothetical protein
MTERNAFDWAEGTAEQRRDWILWGIYDEGARARAAGRPRESNRFGTGGGGIFFTTWDDGWLEEAIADIELDIDIWGESL